MIKHLTPRPAEEIKRIIRSAKIKARKKRIAEISMLSIWLLLFVVFFILRKIDFFKWDKGYNIIYHHIASTLKRKKYFDIETTNLYNRVIFNNNQIL